MNIIKQLERYQKLDELIKKECTGTPCELGVKLQISRSQVYRLIGCLKDYGADINYCRTQQSFFYNNPFNIEIIVPINGLSQSKMENIKGGFIKNIVPSFFMRRNSFTFTPYFAQNRDISYECL